MTETIEPFETRTVKIYCPDCGWMKEVTTDGPAHEEHVPDLSCARYLAEDDAGWHAAERESFGDGTHRPMLFTADGVFRYEPSEGAFIR